MNYIFIDESRISKKNRFQLFGSLWLHRKYQDIFRSDFWKLWDKSFPSRKSELKWTKVSKNKLEIYKNFADYFARLPLIDFRCVVLDTHDIDYQIYHQGDKELGFYKLLYFFLSRNIEKDYHYKILREPYQIFMDSRRRNDEVGRLEDLKNVLNNRLTTICRLIEVPIVRRVEAVPDSKLSPEIQIIDVLLGAVGYAWEGFKTSSSKLSLIKHIQTLFGLTLSRPTPYLTEKFNIWQFKLRKNKKAPHNLLPPKAD